MRKFLAGSFLAFMAAVPAAAQTLPPDPGNWVVSLGVGATIPVGSKSDTLSTGVHGAVTLGYELPNNNIYFGVEGLYLRADNKTSADDHSNILTVMAHTHFGMGTRGGPYIVLGAGVLRDEYKQKLTNLTITNTHAAAAIEAGLGVEFGKIVFIEGRVLHSFRHSEDEYTLIPITLGIRF